MGLGSLLINGNQATDKLQNNEDLVAIDEVLRVARPDIVTSLLTASSRTVDVAGSMLYDESATASFVILYPALGCPGLVPADTRNLEIILVCQEEKDSVTLDHVRKLLEDIFVLRWADTKEPYCKDGQTWDLSKLNPKCLAELMVVSNGVRLLGHPIALSEYKETIKKRPWQLGKLLHTIADIVPHAYEQKGFKSIVSIEVTLQDTTTLPSAEMFTLFYGPENGLLREILQDEAILKKPYDKVPLLTYQGNTSIGGHDRVYRWRDKAQENPNPSRCGDRPREHNVRLFHPFRILPKYRVGQKSEVSPYLNVGHLTDLHLSSLWDFFDEKIFPKFHQDNPIVVNQGQVQGREPKTNAAKDFSVIASRFNNPNLNVRNLTRQLNKQVDIILQTGNLIDFNRGFNHNLSHDPDKDYIFNLNWIRYYELLLLDYERPTFTLIGNQDLRLNPYSSHIKGEINQFFSVLYLLLISAGTGAACGSVFGSLEEKLGKKSGITQTLVAPFTASLSLFTFIKLLQKRELELEIAPNVIFSQMGLTPILGGGWVLGFLIVLVLTSIKSVSQEKVNTPNKGKLAGMAVGGSLGMLGLVIASLLLNKERDSLTRMTNLRDKDLEDLLEKQKGEDSLNQEKAASPNAADQDGGHLSERSYDWYALTINPFTSYAFTYGNTSLLMTNWEGREVLLGNPPIADDFLSDRQWILIEQWVEWLVKRRNELANSNQQVVPILGMHTPVFSPMVEVNLKQLHQNGMATNSSKLRRGTLGKHRKDLIKLFFQLSNGTYPGISKPIPAISLAGHTHTYDVFQMPEENKVFWYQLEHLLTQDQAQLRNEFKGKGLHITTCSSGPPGDDRPPEGTDQKKLEARQQFKQSLKDYDTRKNSVYDGQPIPKFYQQGNRVLRPAGGRILLFDRSTGNLSKIDEISAQTAKWGDC